MVTQTLSNNQIFDLAETEIDDVNGGVAWFAIPIAVGLALLASEYLHHH